MTEDLTERLVSSQTVFEGRLLTVRVDKVELPNGTHAGREVVRHPGAVAIVALPSPDQVILIRQYRHPAGEVLWELPAGVLEPGEDPAACAQRELIEETGYEAGEIEPLFSTFLSPGFSSEIIHLFVARGLRSIDDHPSEPDEHIDVHIMALDDAVEMVMRGQVRNAAAICGVLAEAERRRARPEELGRIS